MPTGKVKWFDDQKGFGFIQADAGGPEVFVHHSVIQADGFRSLIEGQEVEFEAQTGPKGPKATSVRPLGAPATAANARPEVPPRGKGRLAGPL